MGYVICFMLGTVCGVLLMALVIGGTRDDIWYWQVESLCDTIKVWWKPQ